MNRSKFYSQLWLAGIALLIAFICLPQMSVLAARTMKLTAFDDGKPGKKEKLFKNQNVVKVYPDAIKKAMHVVARPGNQKEIDFVVFDVEGNMILDYKMKSGDRKVIGNLKRGSYTYHVFAADEYLTAGKMEFR